MLKICTHMGVLGPFVERYVPKGYYETLDPKQKLDIFSKIDGLEGLNMSYPRCQSMGTPEDLKKMYDDFGLKIADLGVDLWSDAEWKLGSISARDRKIREKAIKVTKDAMDLSLELGAYSVLLWPAHDGFDYPFETNYHQDWDYIFESLEEIGNWRSNVKVALEYKQKDPRAKAYIDNIGKTLFIIQSLESKNIGAALDLGHCFLAQERAAESLVLLSRVDRLFQIHLNDNYRDSDPDLLFGSINFWDTLELFYWLGTINYEGWINIDICSPRVDPIKMLRLAVKFVKDYEKLAQKLLKNREVIEDNIGMNRFADNMDIVREIIF